jgi:hypothetical protein
VVGRNPLHQSQKLQGWEVWMARMAETWLQAESSRIESRGKPQNSFLSAPSCFPPT